MAAGWAAAEAGVGVDVGSDLDADVDADAECVELLAPQAARPPDRQSARTAARITHPTIPPADYEPLTQPSVNRLVIPRALGRAAISPALLRLGALEGRDTQGRRHQRRARDQGRRGRRQLAVASGQDPGHRVGQVTGDTDLQPLRPRSLAGGGHAVRERYVAGPKQASQVRSLGVAVHVEPEQPPGDPRCQECAGADGRAQPDQAPDELAVHAAPTLPLVHESRQEVEALQGLLDRGYGAAGARF